MSDNIRSFSDYRKKVNHDKQQTEEINIEIQDPLDFLSASEREEYYRTQHEKMDEERNQIDEKSDDYFFDDDFEVQAPEDIDDEDVKEKEPNVQRSAKQKSEKVYKEEEISEKKSSGKLLREHADKSLKKRSSQPLDEEGDWYDEDDDRKGGINPYIVVRIASIVTGIVILVLIALIFKAKVIDSVIGNDPDKEETVAIGEVEGYTETNDTVVTTVQLNLRSTPSTESDSFIVTQVPAGTELNRVAVEDSGGWAQVEYEGQRLYCAMKYLTVKE